jgi:hypothetical protein
VHGPRPTCIEWLRLGGCPALSAYIESLGRGLILLDGRPTAGKTILAKARVTRIRCVVVDCDAFVVCKQDKLIGALTLTSLDEDTLRQEVES